MSDVFDPKHLYAIIRKPQEGKTFICLENINQNDEYIHFVLTMNTIKSSRQFFQRAIDKFNGQICMLNSKPDIKETYHKKTSFEVSRCLRNKEYKIVIMCGHPTRFKSSLIDILDSLTDSKTFNKNIIIHIDESHEYIPKYRKYVNEINNFDIVERIYCYSATPFNMWINEKIKSKDKEKFNDLFKNIYVVDVEKQFNILSTGDYFGVKDVDPFIWPSPDKLEHMGIPRQIPDELCFLYNSKYEEGKSYYFFSKERTYFSCGHEWEFLSYAKYALLRMLQIGYVKNTEYSYNFIPAYLRVITHFVIKDIILQIFDNAIVIVVNGYGSKAFIMQDNKQLEIELNDKMNEPSDQIYEVIKKYPNKPLFVTGCICIGMSVTLINQNTGNFDNVLASFPQYKDSPGVLYQMCRFLFNYTSWTEISKRKIKKTRLISDNSNFYRICLEYEQQIDTIKNEMSGSLRTQSEVSGNVHVKKPKIPKEKIHDKIKEYSTVHKTIQAKVYEGNDEDMWNKIKREYETFKGKEANKKVMPDLNESTSFYECSTTKNKGVQQVQDLKNTINNFKWDSNYQLIKGVYKYARIYVGYDSLDDSTEYTIFLRRMELEKNDFVDNHLESLKN